MLSEKASKSETKAHKQQTQHKLMQEERKHKQWYLQKKTYTTTA